MLSKGSPNNPPRSQGSERFFKHANSQPNDGRTRLLSISLLPSLPPKESSCQLTFRKQGVISTVYQLTAVAMAPKYKLQR